jgi:hypothetical protein
MVNLKHGILGAVKPWSSPDLNGGQKILVPCEVKPGPSTKKRLVHIKTGGIEWSGIVDQAELWGNNIRATVTEVRSDKATFTICGYERASSERRRRAVKS